MSCYIIFCYLFEFITYYLLISLDTVGIYINFYYIFRLMGSSFIGISNFFKFEKLSFDITSVVKGLSSSEKFEEDHIVTLQVQCLDLTGNQTCLFDVFNFEIIKPYLIIYSSEKGKSKNIIIWE